MTCLFSFRSSFQEPSAQRVSVCRPGDGEWPETESQPGPKSRQTAAFASHQPLTDGRWFRPHRRRGRGSEEGLSFGEGTMFKISSNSVSSVSGVGGSLWLFTANYKILTCCNSVILNLANH